MAGLEFWLECHHAPLITLVQDGRFPTMFKIRTLARGFDTLSCSLQVKHFLTRSRILQNSPRPDREILKIRNNNSGRAL